MEEEEKDCLDVCCICLETILIPVEPLCFQCRESDGEISCFSMKRICLVCAENFLDLNKDRKDRSIKKKCIFCPKTCHLYQIPKNKTFRVDYLMMDRVGAHHERSCPYDGCGYHASHLKVARHVFTECPYYHVECECGSVCPRNQLLEHRAHCDKYKCCVFCQTFILEIEMARHMYYHHDKTKCFTCHQFIDMSRLSDHIISDCPERLVTCEVCSSFIRYKSFKNHLRRHIVEVSKNVTLIRNKLREEEATYQNIQRLIEQFSITEDENHAATLITVPNITTTTITTPTGTISSVILAMDHL